MKFILLHPSIAIFGLIIFGLGSLLPIWLIIEGVSGYGLIILLITICGYGVIIHETLVKKVVIDEYGVKYITLRKRYEMTWDEIKIVGIGYIPIKTPGRKPWVYFAANGISFPMLHAKMINEKFFMVGYRKKVEDEIRKYWTQKIDGLDDISEFEKLHKPKRRLT